MHFLLSIHPTAKSAFALEADMHNEPIDPHELNRSSYGNKLVGYLAIFNDHLYKAHYGIPNMQVLNATVSDIHMRNIMKHLQRISTTHSILSYSRPPLNEQVRKQTHYLRPYAHDRVGTRWV